MFLASSSAAVVNVWSALSTVISKIWDLFTSNMLAFFNLVLANENNYIMLVSFALFFIVLTVNFLLKLVHGW